MKKSTMAVVAVIAVLLVVLIAFLVSKVPNNSSNMDNLIEIPDIEDVDEASAKNIISSNGLIPKIEYIYDDYTDEGCVVKTSPEIASKVEKNSKVTIYISKGARYYYLNSAVGRMRNVTGIEPFDWDKKTKGFYTPYVEEGYLYIEMYLCCVSKYTLKFYGDFGTASINDTFDKTVPIDVIYDSKNVDNNGGKTSFTVKIPLSDLGVQKPTNINIKFDFVVDGDRETFTAGFDLSWPK